VITENRQVNNKVKLLHLLLEVSYYSGLGLKMSVLLGCTEFKRLEFELYAGHRFLRYLSRHIAILVTIMTQFWVAVMHMKRCLVV
jgi:hypothetical protein